MSEARLFTIPPHWCWAPLGEIAEVKLGKMLSDKAFEPDLIQLPYLRNQNVRWGAIDYSDIKSMGFKPSELERYGLKPGDLLVCEGGEPGRSAIYTREAGEFMYQKALHRIRPYGGLIQSRYIQLCLWNYVANGLVIPRPSQTTIQHLPRERMLELLIPIAPLSEQERIVAEIEKQFSKLGDAISSLRRVQVKLKRFREVVLGAACEGRLVPTEAELARVEGRGYESASRLLNQGLDLQNLEGVVPEGWVLSRLDQMGAVTGGVTKNSSRESLPVKLPYLRVANVYAGRLDLQEIKNIGVRPGEVERFMLKKDDLLIVEGNGSIDQIGRVALWDDAISPCVHQNHIIKIRLLEPWYAKYFLFWLLSPQGRRHITRLASSTTGLHTLSISKVGALPVAVPPPAEQVRIVAEVERQLSILDSIEVNIDECFTKSINLRSGILRHAFSGQLLPPGSFGESASILLEQIRKSREDQEHNDNHRERTRNPTPRRGQGIKPGVSTPGTGATPAPPKPRRGAGSVQEESAYVPPGLPDLSDAPSLGLKPQALRPGPAGAEEDRGMVPVPASSTERKGEEETAFLDLSRDAQIDLVWESLLGRGAIEKEEAIRTVAQSLRDQGRAQFQRLRQGGPLYQAIATALDRGLREGSFDRPRRGHVRALLTEPKDYSPDEWRLCLLSSLDHAAVEEDDALRAAAEWARETLGLEFARLREDGIIIRGLRSALEEAVRRGEVIRKRGAILKGGSG